MGTSLGWRSRTWVVELLRRVNGCDIGYDICANTLWSMYGIISAEESPSFGPTAIVFGKA
jgi:hypothetical protein